MAKQKPLTLDELLAAAQAAATAAAEAAAAAAADGASEDDKAKASALAQAADDAQTAYDQAKAVADQAAADQKKADDTAAEEAAAAAAAAAAADAAPADAAADPAFVPVFLDEDGERIARNSIIRLVTTTGLNLRSLDGELITPEPTMELLGPDVRNGDWYTEQYKAGLIAVHSVKKLK